jgi:unsaturated chondroitin disaccharide hydrolase
MKYTMNSEDRKWLEQTYEKLVVKLSAQCDRLGTMMPYVPENGVYQDMGAVHLEAWTNGFYSGILWQMFHAEGEEKYAVNAEGIEKRLDAALEAFENLDHDVGFQWLHTSVANYRLTGNVKSRSRGLHAAGILAGRFHIEGDYIQAWNSREKQGIAIIDCLMNLPLLHWAYEETGYISYRQIAEKHTDMALKYIIRPDGSCNHMVEFNPVTGEYLNNPGGQGYGSGSSWSRGQAWAIYGMALAYRYLKKPEYLEAAKSVAHYFLANVALNDYVPLIDFRASEKPVYLDTTAGVCAACGLLEIAEFAGEYEKSLYISSAVKCIKAMDPYCVWNPETDSILSHGSARYDREYDREVPIIYGDYFLTEGILRLMEKAFLIW